MKFLIMLMLVAVVAWSFFRPSRRGKMDFTSLLDDQAEKIDTTTKDKSTESDTNDSHVK